MSLHVVLLHAFPLSSAMWQGQREGLGVAAGRDIVLHTPDLMGFGSARMSMEPPDIGWMASAVMHHLDQLGLRKVVLGGLSMGGYVAMEILRRRPSVAQALVLADTKASADPDAARENRERIAKRLDDEGSADVLVEEVLPNLLGSTTRAHRPRLVEMVRAEVEKADPEAAAWAQRAMAQRPDYFDVLHSIDVPALVVVGEEDQLSPVADAQAMVDALPQGRLAVLPRSGHLSAVEATKEFNRAVGEFVAEAAR